MNKNDLQTEIKALQEYRREAESLIEKINSVTKKMENDVVNDIEKIKKQIAENMNEMFSYVSPDIYETQSISVRDFVERDEKGTYPLAYFSIKFGQKNYGRDKNIQTVIEILCRNWDSILKGAYQKIKEAYRKDTEKKLQETLQMNTEVQVRRSRLNNSANKEEK